MPATPTPSQTVAEFLEALPLVDGRIFAAQDEILRRLANELPEKIDALNTQLGHPPDTGIAHPQAYYVAPAVLTNDYLNTVCVAVELKTMALAPGVFKNEAVATVYSIDEAVQVKEQVRDLFDRSGAIRGVLYHYLTGCVDLAGRRVWRLLEPTGVSMLPAELAQGQYSGTACTYRLVQSPDDDNWI